MLLLRRALLCLLVTSSLAPLTAAAAVPPAAEYAAQAVGATNAKRADHDLRPLRRSDCLQGFARRQARRMAHEQRMFHQDLGPVLRQCELGRVGENVAYGYPTGRAVVRAWMRSRGHRANILSEHYRLMGLAARRGTDGSWYVAQVFGARS
jgi:uncharacterized protein YkwD